MVKMSEQKDLSADKATVVGGGFNINPLDIIMYLLSRWYWFVISIALFGGYAWYQYAKTPYLYMRSATVMIKGATHRNAPNGMERFQSYSYTNISNEILQLKSYKLMKDAVSRLDANICYIIMDQLREKELYTQSPVKVSFIDENAPRVCSLKVEPMDAKRVRLSAFSNSDNKLSANMGDTIKTSLGNIIVTPTLHYSESWYGTKVEVRRQSIDAIASLFRSNLNVSQTESDAAILHVSLADYNTARAEDVLNTLINIYNEETIKDKNQAMTNASNFINERLVLIEKELGTVETDIETYKKANDMIDIGSSASMSFSQKQQYSSQSKELQMQLKMAEFIKEYLEDPTKARDLIPANTGVDMNIETQIAIYNTNKLKRDKLIEGSSNKNPVVQELNLTLNAMRQNIIGAVDNTITGISAKLNEAQNMASQAQYKVSHVPTQQREMASKQRQHRIKEELYLYLLNKREENILAQATTEYDARVLDPAGGDDSPISPKAQAQIVQGVMKGAALPFVILMAMLFFDTRIRSRKDVEDATSVPFLGEIPNDKQKKTEKINGEEKVVLRIGGRDIISESFRIVRTNMNFMRVKSEEMKVITFSSFGAGAGKTYVSTHLAASFAQTEKKIVFLDLDIRKRTLTSMCALQKERKGMTTYLAGDANIDEIIHKNVLCDNLDIIPAGPLAPNPSELLMSNRLDELIAELRTRYDYIFLDNVPVHVVADATITNRVTDLTIFVLRVGKIDRRMLPELEKLYRSEQLKNMALILNGSQPKRMGYGYGYGYG